MERAAGRVRADADTHAAATMLLGACVLRAYAYDAVGGPPQPVEVFAASLARTVLAGIA